jgi:heme-degrading monooxygenase HmoA
MTATSEHFVIVTFETDPAAQDAALEKIGAYVGSFLSKQPGFVASTLHRGLDGRSIVHYAKWQSEAAFQAAGVKARAHPDLPALLAYKPTGRGYQAWKSF